MAALLLYGGRMVAHLSNRAHLSDGGPVVRWWPCGHMVVVWWSYGSPAVGWQPSSRMAAQQSYGGPAVRLQPSGLMACAIAIPVWEGDQFASLVSELPVDVLTNRVEATLPDGEPDAHMLVLRKQQG